MSASRTVFICPLCGDQIEALVPEDTRGLPFTPFPSSGDPLRDHVEARVRQNVEANEAVLEMHLGLNHTMPEALRALGTARNALMDIREAARGDDLKHEIGPYLEEIVERGLGGK